MNRALGTQIVAGVFVVLIAIPVVVFAAPQALGATESYAVLSSSMSPTIESGDVILVESVPPEEIEEGDIITFRRPAEANGTVAKRPTTHRVAEVVTQNGSRQFRTRGDANEEIDRMVIPQENVIGRVEHTVPYLGYLSLYMGTTQGFLVLVGIPIVLLIGSEVYAIVFELRK